MEQRSEIADGMRIDWDVPIEMDDGNVLCADVFRPIEDGRYPVILTHGPYGKNYPFAQYWPWQWSVLTSTWPEVMQGTTAKYAVWETVDPEKWTPEGYACVRVDSRGAGRSPGYLDPFSIRETRDFHDCIEWAGTQPWSNGRVGLNGISYYAINQWHVAALQPPHLAAICVWEGAADWYRDMNYHGGILSEFWPWLAVEGIWSVQHGLGERGPRNQYTGELVCGGTTLSDEELATNRADIEAQLRANPLDGPYYRERSADWSRVEVPLLSSANWGGQGLHTRGNFEGYLRSASQEKWLECHGLEHWTTFYLDSGRALQFGFFDHFLKNEGDWAEAQPSVSIQVRHVGGEFVGRAEHAWPLDRTEWTRWHLDADDLSLSREVATDPATVTYPGLGSGATFSSPARDEALEITGPIAAKLWVSSTTTDADLFLILRLFAPDCEEIHVVGAVDPRTPIAQGWLRASHRKLDPDLSESWRPYHTHDEIQQLVSGQVYELDVEIWPTSIVVPAGHRLALTVQGRDYDHGGQGIPIGDFEMRGSAVFTHADPLDRPPEIYGGDVTIHTGGATPSYILLPVIPTA
jgi:uncharacterized protein